MNQKTILVAVEGRVQGVYFRKWTETKARQLGLTGWVRNRHNGTVEALFSGDIKAVDEMLSNCYVGPKFARVETVRYDIVDTNTGNCFIVKSTS